MAGEWIDTTVGDIFDLVNGYAFKSTDFLKQGIPVIKIRNIKAGEFNEHDFSYVSEKFLCNQNNKLAQFGDLLISMSGNRHDGSPETWVGKVAQFRKNEKHFINQRVGALRIKPNKEIDSRFASYILSSLPYQKLFIAIATSSGGQANLSPAQILSTQIRIPLLPEQRAIAHILGTLDDKIELNRRMNQTLEDMARALFKSWFVDFDGVAPEDMQESELGLIPKGWRTSTIGECFALTMGQSPPGDTYNEASEGLPFFQGRTDFGFRYPENRKYCSAPARIASAEDTLVSVRAPVGDINLALEQCCIGRGVAAIRHLSNARYFTYHAMRSMQDELRKFEHTGTVFGSINKNQFNSLQFIEPNLEAIACYEQTTSTLDDRIKNNIIESRNLKQLRDALLPKLISGELRTLRMGAIQ